MKEFRIPVENNSQVGLIMKVITPSYEQVKEFIIKEGEIIHIGSSSEDNFEIFNKTVAPKHLKITLEENNFVIQSEFEQTHFDKKTKQIYLGQVKIEIKALMNSVIQYEPIPDGLFKILISKQNRALSFFFFLAVCSTLYLIWFGDNYMFSHGIDDIGTDNYVTTFLSPTFILASVYCLYTFMEYKLSKFRPKNKSSAIYRATVEKAFWLVSTYLVLNTALYIMRDNAFVEQNYVLIKLVGISSLFIYMNWYINFLYNSPKQYKIKQAIYATTPFVMSLILFSGSISTPMYSIGKSEVQIMDNSSLEEKTMNFIEESIKNSETEED